ncbi:integrase/recombinase XerD [Lactovum miscens]|uniref:Integrase/recombinase XerD n=1 Tax=Lactovum miscens TaxID=190387 RepID=A0A841C5E6_9LACT|nr:integrase/recombinase XerD [Lactovum miscens]
MIGIQKMLESYPEFVKDFYFSKVSNNYSYATLYDYMLEYKKFFHWLIKKKILNVSSIKEITLKQLEDLHRNDIERFIIDERTRLENIREGNHLKALHRLLASLKTLYNYLSFEAENELGDPYILKNIMLRVSIKKESDTLNYRASKLDGKLFLGLETNSFLNFVEHDYENLISPRALTSFKKNKERDLAILSLFLASGIRNAELVNTDFKDFELSKRLVSVMRKEGNRDTVPFAPFASKFLKNYLDVRTLKYFADENTEALFLTLHNGQPSRISSAAINKLVEKYSQAYKVRVTPHMLRHTLATRLYMNTHDQVLVATQLGHSSTSATQLYTHIAQSELHNALDRL